MAGATERDPKKKRLKEHYRVEGEEMIMDNIVLPANVVEDLRALRNSYQRVWFENDDNPRKHDVTYEKVFERLISASALGHLDPDVWKDFAAHRALRDCSVRKRRTRPRRRFKI